MYEVYGDMKSGNCYKIKLILEFLDLEHEWIHVDILKNETHSTSFKELNPNCKIPAVVLPTGKALWESNAILNYIAKGSSFLPDERFLNAQVLQWQFFEQYSHEPYIATARYINKYLGLPHERQKEYESKQNGGHKALAVMDNHLSKMKYFVGNAPTIADISLYAYTHVAPEGGFSLEQYKNINRWLSDFEKIPGYLDMSGNRLVKTVVKPAFTEN